MLVNSGSVARDHLASERTFLAYVRTSLGIASMGVAIIQLFRVSSSALSEQAKQFARPLGVALVVTGIFTLATGVYRFFAVQNALIVGKYPASRFSIILPALILGIVISILFSILLSVRSDAY